MYKDLRVAAIVPAHNESLLIGKTMVGMRAADLVRGVDLLAARPEVDASRIAATGRAAAAIPALFAALFDNRIKSLALDGMAGVL